MSRSEAENKGLVFQDFTGDGYMNAEELGFKPERNFLSMSDAWYQHKNNEESVSIGMERRNAEARKTLASCRSVASELIAGAEKKIGGHS